MFPFVRDGTSVVHPSLHLKPFAGHMLMLEPPPQTAFAAPMASSGLSHSPSILQRIREPRAPTLPRPRFGKCLPVPFAMLWSHFNYVYFILSISFADVLMEKFSSFLLTNSYGALLVFLSLVSFFCLLLFNLFRWMLKLHLVLFCCFLYILPICITYTMLREHPSGTQLRAGFRLCSLCSLSQVLLFCRNHNLRFQDVCRLVGCD